MSSNEPKVKDNELFNKVRKAIYHRGLWLGFIVKVAQEKGYDWEDMCRKAVRQCGCFQGNEGKEKMKNTESLLCFANCFFPEETQNMFDMEVKRFDEEEICFEFGYCPLVQAWTDLGFEGETLSALCDIAMEGDRGIAGQFDRFEFKLGKTIAQGHPVCEVKFLKK
ncbi:L-2-amino-thiazoline-4-carboxylic acid hydrolase [Lutispora saccharofermentans]|uniref:L-2-amino-thiazoline-4-carboxylic acid hydrolase n=1 Tax=Lutispora saccharofermentans TaxID=3024236 RepID=A0ABT1NF09_9FIRM|nr:L-2-amino-thiazoline-4-carboxylic acid hydrolase [Lutispora saccharofermentans]MCQ1528936.1 L-2-amino-thiazoline-4-carboxylic acid hydrolase [Lutispora saccharofermentans]